MSTELIGDSREMAPKRRRMMDMVLVLGGLKEESAVPLSRVNEEIATLKNGISPLMESILSFPDTYFEAFFKAAEKTDLIGSLKDKGIITEALSNLERAESTGPAVGIQGIAGLLRSRVQKMQTRTEKTAGAETEIDLPETLTSLSDTLVLIEQAVKEFEQKARVDGESADSELKEIVGKLHDLIPRLDTAPDEAFDELQKLGTKTRYGPFLRMSAQVKRGKREGRIGDEEFRRLVRTNAVTELHRGIMLFILDKMGSRTAVQLAELMRVPARTVQRATVSMIQRGEVEMVGLAKDAPVFARVLGAAPQTTLMLKRVIQQLRGATKSVKGDSLSAVQKLLERLQVVHEKLQILGQYNETQLSEPMNRLREQADVLTQAVLSSRSSESAEDLRLLVSAGLEAFAKFNLKIVLEKGPNLVTGTNVYGQKMDKETYERLVSKYLDNEVERGTILVLLREIGAMTAHDLAERTRIPQDRVFKHLLKMKRDELLTAVGEAHGYVLYDVPRTPTEQELTVRTVSELAVQLNSAKNELKSLLQELKPQDIGRLANSLEVLSKGREKLAKLTVGGSVVAADVLSAVEGKIKSAVAMAYRTRARLPSTRQKVTIDDLMDVDVPSVLDEYRDMMGYAPLLGFGTIEWDNSKCLGCKSCEIACPEDAIFLRPVVDVPKFFEFSEDEIGKLPVNKALFYRTVRALATEKPAEKLVFTKDTSGFGTVEVDLWLCVACRTCVRRCPGPDTGALDLELKWNLPDVVRHMVTASE